MTGSGMGLWLVASAVATALGILPAVFLAVWMWMDGTTRREARTLEREIDRANAQREIDLAAWERSRKRYRAQRAELLVLLERARTEAAERRQEALAREAQIRRQIHDSEFGTLV
ncbi:MAG: hypothetical protein JNM26_14830 [Ideonella sp.]|nr:hypothetical protein [Ideonella sp.]